MSTTTFATLRSLTSLLKANAPAAPAAPTVVSRHQTATGSTVWSRCTCGRLRMTYSPGRAAGPGDRPLVAGGRTPGCPDCP